MHEGGQNDIVRFVVTQVEERLAFVLILVPVGHSM